MDKLFQVLLQFNIEVDVLVPDINLLTRGYVMVIFMFRWSDKPNYPRVPLLINKVPNLQIYIKGLVVAGRKV